MQTVGSMCRGCAWVRGIGWLGSDAPEFLNRGLFAKGWQDDVKCRVLGLHRDPCHQLVPYGACGVLLCMEGWLILSLGRAFLLLWVTWKAPLGLRIFSRL